MFEPTTTVTASSLPKSATSMWINHIGLCSFLVTLFLSRQYTEPDTLTVLCIAFFALAFPIIVLELIFLKTWKRTSTGFDFSLSGPHVYDRAFWKLLGFYTTLIFLLSLYWLFPEYDGTFYKSFFSVLLYAIPIAALIAIPYFFFLERYNRLPFDGYWQTSLLLRGRFTDIDTRTLQQHALAWLVKFFFLPLMFVYCFQNIEIFRTTDFSLVFSSYTSLYFFLYSLLFFIDVAFATVGYVCTIRVFDTHIRSTDPTMLGWIVTLVCYQPFWSVIQSSYLQNTENHIWQQWFAGYPELYFIWGTMIILCIGVYAWSTLTFGVRFSNLTHRGILTNGPYKYSKHPAYVSKNISWWLISLPFLSEVGIEMAVGHCLMLFAVNVIYVLRARTEERHLSLDPTYVAYATAMEKEGVFRWIGAWFPILRYKPHALFNYSEHSAPSSQTLSTFSNTSMTEIPYNKS